MIIENIVPSHASEVKLPSDFIGQSVQDDKCI